MTFQVFSATDFLVVATNKQGDNTVLEYCNSRSEAHKKAKQYRKNRSYKRLTIRVASRS